MEYKMNIEELLKNMKKRPGMYVLEINLEYIYTYLSGFLFSRLNLNKADYIDIAFKEQFREWIKEWIKNNIKEDFVFPSGWGYVSIICKVWKDEEERVNRFFELAETFFKELEEK